MNFESFNRIRAEVESRLGKLSPRERVLVAAAGVGFALFVLLIVSAGVSSAISTREERIEAKTRALTQVGKLSQGYRQAQVERQALEARLKGQSLPLMSFISQTGSSLGIEVNDLRPGTAPAAAKGIQEETVEVSLPGLDLVKLTKLLEKLEGSPTILAKVRRLSLRTRSDDPMLVNVTLVVATYRLKT